MEEFDLLLKYIKRKIYTFFAVMFFLAITAFIMWSELIITYVVCDDEIVTVLSYTDNTELIIGRSGIKVGKDNKAIFGVMDSNFAEKIKILFEELKGANC